MKFRVLLLLIACCRLRYSCGFIAPAVHNHQSRVRVSKIIGRPAKPLVTKVVPVWPLASAAEDKALEDVTKNTQNENADSTDLLPRTYQTLGIASAVSWLLVASAVLMKRDPLFGHSVSHNALNVAQSLTFPIPVLWATVTSLQSAATVGWSRLKSQTYRRLNLGLALCSLWLMFSAAFPTLFCFGYDLVPLTLKVLGAMVHGLTATVCLAVWTKTVGYAGGVGRLVSRITKGVLGSFFKIIPSNPSDDPDSSNGLSTMYAIATMGFFWFSLSPVVTMYPTAALPSILGKRLSRPATAFTWLATVALYNLKDAADRDRLTASTFVRLSNGLMLGSALHLGLILLKIIGIDGGGLFIPGNSLWEVYPEMMAVPFCTSASLLLHGIVVWAGWSRVQNA